MWPSNFSPNDSNFCPSNFSLCTVDKGDFLPKIETKGILDLMEKGALAKTNFADFVSFTPSIWIKLRSESAVTRCYLELSSIAKPLTYLVPGYVLRLPR